MRKVTEKAAEALKAFNKMKSGNTEVQVWQLGASLRLHGHIIATHYQDERLVLDDCGWRTATTKERLNGVLDAFNSKWRIYQESSIWYITDGCGVRKEWTGTLTLEVA